MDMPSPAPKKGESKGLSSLFKSSAPAPKSGIDLNMLSENLNDISRRLRVVEERYSGLRKKNLITEEHMMASHKRVSTEIKTITSDINEVRKQIDDLNDHVVQIIQELKKAAKKEDIKIIERYLYFWKPVNFITRDEAENIVNEVLEEKRAKTLNKD